MQVIPFESYSSVQQVRDRVAGRPVSKRRQLGLHRLCSEPGIPGGSDAGRLIFRSQVPVNIDIHRLLSEAS